MVPKAAIEADCSPFAPPHNLKRQFRLEFNNYYRLVRLPDFNSLSSGLYVTFFAAGSSRRIVWSYLLASYFRAA